MTKINTILVNRRGPLPISFEYTPQSDTVETIAFSGSIHTGDLAFKNIGFDLKVNGQLVGSSTIYTRDTGGHHHPTIPVMINYDIPFIIKDFKVQPVTIELVPHTWDTLSNENDFFNVAIFY